MNTIERGTWLHKGHKVKFTILEDEPTSMFYGNPYDIECDDIDEVISFYENTEEYEKCSELLYVKNDIIADGLTKKLIRKCLIEN